MKKILITLFFLCLISCSSGDSSSTDELAADGSSDSSDSGSTTTDSSSSDSSTTADSTAKDSSATTPAIDDSEVGSGSQPVAGTLTAGDIDDNLNYDSFTSYINGVLQSNSTDYELSLAVNDRIQIVAVDNNGNGISNGRVSFRNEQGKVLYQSQLNQAGVFNFLPANDGVSNTVTLTAVVESIGDNTASASVTFNLNQLSETRAFNLTVDTSNQLRQTLELSLVIDTTGSMADELAYILTELESIVDQINQDYPQVTMRFSVVVYRDVGDQYIVRHNDFTSDLDEVKTFLSQQTANGGGDYPEAMDQALEQALKLQWSSNSAVKMLFLIADAPPHSNKFEATYEHANTMREQGIQMHAVAASGVADSAEFLMRSMAFITAGRYIFLTDDSGVGNSHAEPKVACYIVTKLNDLIVRVISSELSASRVEPDQQDIIRTSGNYQNGVCQ